MARHATATLPKIVCSASAPTFGPGTSACCRRRRGTATAAQERWVWRRREGLTDVVACRCRRSRPGAGESLLTHPAAAHDRVGMQRAEASAVAMRTWLAGLKRQHAAPTRRRVATGCEERQRSSVNANPARRGVVHDRAGGYGATGPANADHLLIVAQIRGRWNVTTRSSGCWAGRATAAAGPDGASGSGDRPPT
jgi:hypothetical protein